MCRMNGCIYLITGGSKYIYRRIGILDTFSLSDMYGICFGLESTPKHNIFAWTFSLVPCGNIYRDFVNRYPIFLFELSRIVAKLFESHIVRGFWQIWSNVKQVIIDFTKFWMIAAVEAASKRFSPKGEKLRKSLSRSGSGLYWIFGVAQCVDQDVPSKRLS